MRSRCAELIDKRKSEVQNRACISLLYLCEVRVQ